MQRMQKVLSVLLALAMLLAVVPLTGLSMKASAASLSEIRQQYPPGGHWYGSYSNASECHGFALMVADMFYGSGQARSFSKHYDYSAIKAGDIIRHKNSEGQDGHTAWVIAVNGDTLTLGECNWSSTDYCVISWTRTTTKSKLASGDGIYVLSAPYALDGAINPNPTFDACLDECIADGESFDLAATSTARIVGWAYCSDGSETTVFWCIDDQEAHECTKYNRGDVVDAYGNSQLNCGFYADIPIIDLDIGQHKLSIWCSSSSGAKEMSTSHFNVFLPFFPSRLEQKVDEGATYDLTTTSTISIEGWAFCKDGSETTVWWILDDQPANACMKCDRVDLVQRFGNIQLNCGFKADIPIGTLSEGQHTLTIKCSSSSGVKEMGTSHFNVFLPFFPSFMEQKVDEGATYDLTTTSTISIEGWAFCKDGSETTVWWILDDQPANACMKCDRVDLVQRFGNIQLNCGFKADIPIGTLSEGQHTLTIKCSSSSGVKEMGTSYFNVFLPFFPSCMEQKVDEGATYDLAATSTIPIEGWAFCKDGSETTVWWIIDDQPANACMKCDRVDLVQRFGNIQLNCGFKADIPIGTLSEGQHTLTIKCSSSSGVKEMGQSHFMVYIPGFIVYFNANGGSCSTFSKTVTYYSAYRDLPTPTRAGYTFSGWYTSASGGAQITKDSIVTITANQTLYAHWTANIYTVIFNGNGSTSGSMSNQSFTYDVAQNLTANAFQRKYTVTYNYNGATGGNSASTAAATATFNGWATSASGAKVYDNKQSVKNLATSGTVNLYANWTLGTVTLPTPTKAGYSFGGWYTDSALTTSAGAAGASYKPTANVTLYAHWTAIGYSVTLDPDGGECGIPAITAHYGESYGVLPTAMRDGFTFDGWFASDGTLVTESTVCLTADDHTLTAHWTAVEPVAALTAKADSTTVVDEARGLLYGLDFDLTEEALREQYLDVADGLRMEIVSETGAIGTGAVVQLIDDATGDVVESFTIIIYGDLTGDGLLNTTDITVLRSINASMTEYPDDSPFLLAADVTHDGLVNTTDITALRSANATLSAISQTV